MKIHLPIHTMSQYPPFHTVVRQYASFDTQYDDLVRHVITHGAPRDNRTGITTYSIFAPPPLSFNLTTNFPILTTKYVSLKTIFEELAWFLRGETHNKYLNDKGVHIWDKNAALHNQQGDLGPIYGWQWRMFGAPYLPSASPLASGFDQIYYILDLILHDPTSRRILISAWNPPQLLDMALPPCHILCQFYVGFENKVPTTLSAHIYMRSCDIGLGLPYNVSSYALLLHLISHVVCLTPLHLTFSFGDVHIYHNHVDPLRFQIDLCKFASPSLHISSPQPIATDSNYSTEDALSALLSITYSSIELRNYYSQAKLDLPLAV